MIPRGGHPYALVCLLGLNGLRVSEAWNADITDLGGNRYTPTLHVIGKGNKPAEIVLNPRTQHAIDQAINNRTDGPILGVHPLSRTPRLRGWTCVRQQQATETTKVHQGVQA